MEIMPKFKRKTAGPSAPAKAPAAHAELPIWSMVFTTVLWLMADLGTKEIIESESFKETIVIPNVFALTRHHNTGIAFGIQLPALSQLILSVALIGFIIYVAVTTLKKNPRQRLLKQILFGIIIGGALGNLISRFQNGFVTDFLRFPYFPVFNIADIGVTVGLALLFIVLWRDEVQAPR